MTRISDGKGRGYDVAVNSNNQLVTRSTIVEQRLVSSVDHNYFEAHTGLINLGDDREKGIVYLSNGTSLGTVIVIDRVFYDAWNSNSPSGYDGYMSYYKNPTVTGGEDIEPVNTNFGSNRAAEGDFKINLDTISGTSWWQAYLPERTSKVSNEGLIVIPAGYSFGISVTPPPGNIGMNISINVAFFYLDSNLI